MKTLRVFYTIHQRINGSTNYKKIKGHSDFSHEDHAQAYRELKDKHGEFFMDPRTQRAPDEWIEIHSHTFVDPSRERAVIEAENRVQDALLTPMMLKESQSRKPQPTYVPRGRQ